MNLREFFRGALSSLENRGWLHKRANVAGYRVLSDDNLFWPALKDLVEISQTAILSGRCTTDGNLYLESVISACEELSKTLPVDGTARYDMNVTRLSFGGEMQENGYIGKLSFPPLEIYLLVVEKYRLIHGVAVSLEKSWCDCPEANGIVKSAEAKVIATAQARARAFLAELS